MKRHVLRAVCALLTGVAGWSGAMADRLPAPRPGTVDLGGIRLDLEIRDGRTVLKRSGGTLDFPEGGSLVAASDSLILFDATGTLVESVPHDARFDQTLLKRMAFVERYSATDLQPTRSGTLARLEVFGLPVDGAALKQVAERDRPGLFAISGASCSPTCSGAAEQALERIAGDLERMDVRILESASRILVGFGPPHAEAPPAYMVAADPDAPLFLSPGPEAAATDGLGRKLVLFNPAADQAVPGRRPVCVPLGGCGFAEIDALWDVRPEWLEFDRHSRKLTRIVF